MSFPSHRTSTPVRKRFPVFRHRSIPQGPSRERARTADAAPARTMLSIVEACGAPSWRSVMRNFRRLSANFPLQIKRLLMDGACPQHPRSYPAGSSLALWLGVFLSPTAYFIFLVAWARSSLPAPTSGFVVASFCLIPLVALWVCGSMLWRKTRRIGGVVLTVLAMALQIGFLLFIVVSAVTVAISLP